MIWIISIDVYDLFNSGTLGSTFKINQCISSSIEYSESPYGVGGSSTSNGVQEKQKCLPEGAELGPHGYNGFS